MGSWDKAAMPPAVVNEVPKAVTAAQTAAQTIRVKGKGANMLRIGSQLRMFELETLLAFGVGAGLVALAPLVRRMGHAPLGDSMSQAGRSLAKGGIKVGVTVAGVAGSAARNVAKHASEAAEGLIDLVAEANSEMEATPVEVTLSKPAATKKVSKSVVSSIPVD